MNQPVSYGFHCEDNTDPDYMHREAFWREVEQRGADASEIHDIIDNGFTPPPELVDLLAKEATGTIGLTERLHAYWLMYNALHREIPKRVANDYPEYSRYAAEVER